MEFESRFGKRVGNRLWLSKRSRLSLPECLGSRFEMEFEIASSGCDRVWAESRFEVDFLRL